MELIAVARHLWARRRLVALGLLVSVAAGVLVVYKVSPGLPPKLHSRLHPVGEAAAQVLVDTPNSQIADLNPTGAPVLYARASLLADLMATAPVQQAVARQAGIGSGELAVLPPATSIVAPIKASPVAAAGTRAGTPLAAWQLSVTVDPNLPIIAFDALAPSSRGAQDLAGAAISVLRQRLTGIAVQQHIPARQRAVLNPIGPPISTVVLQGPRKLYGVVAALFVFVLISLGIVVGSALAARRTAARRPRSPEPEPNGSGDLVAAGANGKHGALLAGIHDVAATIKHVEQG